MTSLGNCTAHEVAIIHVLVRNVAVKGLNRFRLQRFYTIRCNSVWTRQDFGLVITIHEIVLTNHSKGQR